MKVWQRWKQTALHNKALVVTSILVALGTIFYSGAAVVQVMIMRRSAADSAEQAKNILAQAEKNAQAARDFADAAQAQAENLRRLTEESRRQANIANDALGLNRESSRLGQRAWVAVADANAALDKRPFEITATITNVGRTPALKVQPSYVWRIDSSGNPLHFEGLPAPRSGYVLNPGEKQGLMIADTVPNGKYEAIEDDIRNGALRGYFYGEIAYLDVFQRTHHATFCFVANPKLMRMQTCDIHNKAD
jgi:hypothetical protein